ncbi:MAG: response regulator [Hyphomicrobiales bacterium]
MKTYDLSDISALVVDDNAHMCRMIRAMLNGFGIRTVVEATDGADGLERVATRPVDILIIDWEMPVLDGAEMVRMIRNPEHELAYCPIIMLTGHCTENRTRQALELGVNDILSKPCSSKALYLRILDAVVRPRPFIRSDTYFGPKPRTEVNAKKVREQPELIDKRSNIPSGQDAADAFML